MVGDFYRISAYFHPQYPQYPIASSKVTHLRKTLIHRIAKMKNGEDQTLYHSTIISYLTQLFFLHMFNIGNTTQYDVT